METSLSWISLDFVGMEMVGHAVLVQAMALQRNQSIVLMTQERHLCNTATRFLNYRILSQSSAD